MKQQTVLTDEEIIKAWGYELTIKCPECESVLLNDEQYQCDTCGGGQIHVMQWIRENRQASKQKALQQSHAELLAALTSFCAEFKRDFPFLAKSGLHENYDKSLTAIANAEKLK